VVKGGYRSRFTENKVALSQFTKNTTLAFHASRKIKENILENHGSRPLWKSRFKREKMAISHFTGNKKGRSRVTKIPFTTLFYQPLTPLVSSFKLKSNHEATIKEDAVTRVDPQAYNASSLCKTPSV